MSGQLSVKQVGTTTARYDYTSRNDYDFAAISLRFAGTIIV